MLNRFVGVWTLAVYQTLSAAVDGYDRFDAISVHVTASFEPTMVINRGVRVLPKRRPIDNDLMQNLYGRFT
jgi:hypothetical protein